jgi:hypothetical protein
MLDPDNFDYHFPEYVWFDLKHNELVLLPFDNVGMAKAIYPFSSRSWTIERMRRFPIVELSSRQLFYIGVL